MKRERLEEVLGVGLRFETVDPALIHSDRQHYQRHLIQPHVDEEIEKFRKHGVKPDLHLLVAKRPDGSFWVIDHQHHCEALVRLDIDLVECLVFDSTGYEFEKAAFDAFQHEQRKHPE